MNEIIISNDWLILSSVDYNQFQYFIDQIKELEDSEDINHWVKWKYYDNQVVLQTRNFFFKIYKNDLLCGKFITTLRKELSKIYTRLGIQWDIYIKKLDAYYQVERREKLNVCNEEFDFKSIIIKWNSIHKELEKKLGLDLILKQLHMRGEFLNVHELRLVRDCINKPEDYGIKDNNIVLLDDSDFFIAPVDKNGKWISVQFNSYDIDSIFGDAVFAPQDMFDIIKDDDLLEYSSTKVNKWFLFDKYYTNQNSQIMKDLRTKREEIIADNIEFMSNLNLIEKK